MKISALLHILGMKKERERWSFSLFIFYLTPKPGPIVLGRSISDGEAGGIGSGGNNAYSNSIVPGGLLVRS